MDSVDINSQQDYCPKYEVMEIKGRLRANIFESADTVHLVLLLFRCRIRCAAAAGFKMSARNRLLCFIITGLESTETQKKMPGFDTHIF